MRRFSEKEKEYISIICRETRNPRNSFLPVNLLFDYLFQQGVGYPIGSNRLVFDRKVDNVAVSEIIAIENHILELAILLDYLEKNGLIMYVKDGASKPDNVIGKVVKNGIAKITAPIVTEQLTKASSYRIVVGETLRDLVINNFKTNEDQTLEIAREQSMLAQKSLEEAQRQSQSAVNTLKESKEQTRLANESLDESRKQTQNATDALTEARKQAQNASETLEEARKQTELAQQRLDEAKEQTKSALEATAEARNQTKLAQESLSVAQEQTKKAGETLEESRKQTKWANLNSLLAFIAIIISIVTFCLNRCATQHVVVDECHSINKACEIKQPSKERDTNAVTIKAKEPPVIQKVDKTTQKTRP